MRWNQIILFIFVLSSLSSCTKQSSTGNSGSSSNTLQIQYSEILNIYPLGGYVGIGCVLSPGQTQTIATYKITPNLPAGLTVNSYGCISGIPTAVSTKTQYTLTQVSNNTTQTATFSFAIAMVAPWGVQYPPINIFSLGSADATIALVPPFNNNYPTVTYMYSPAQFSISPALPTGFSLSSSTGTISGVPTNLVSPQTYTVTAQNQVGTTSATFSFGVISGAAFTSLSYSVCYQTSNGNIFTPTLPTGTQISISPNVSCGPLPPIPPYSTGFPVTYSVTPALPAGLTINSTNGIISGSPTAGTVQTTYIVSATSSPGTTTATFTLQIVDQSKWVPPVYPAGNAM